MLEKLIQRFIDARQRQAAQRLVEQIDEINGTTHVTDVEVAMGIRQLTMSGIDQAVSLARTRLIRSIANMNRNIELRRRVEEMRRARHNETKMIFLHRNSLRAPMFGDIIYVDWDPDQEIIGLNIKVSTTPGGYHLATRDDEVRILKQITDLAVVPYTADTWEAIRCLTEVSRASLADVYHLNKTQYDNQADPRQISDNYFGDDLEDTPSFPVIFTSSKLGGL